MIKKKTFFCDIDGTLLKYREFVTYKTNQAIPIESTIEYITQQFLTHNQALLILQLSLKLPMVIQPEEVL